MIRPADEPGLFDVFEKLSDCKFAPPLDRDTGFTGDGADLFEYNVKMCIDGVDGGTSPF